MNLSLAIVATAAALLASAGCGAEPQSETLQSVQREVTEESTSNEADLDQLAPSGKVRIAGPDGEMLEGLYIDADDHRQAVPRAADAMLRAKRDLTDDERRSFLFVEASAVRNEQGRLVGYFVDRYYPIEEYRRLLPEHVAAVASALEES